MEKRINKIVFVIVCWLGGCLCIDRFMRGQIGLGVVKLLTCGGMVVWSLIDLIIAITKLSQYDEEFVFVDGLYAEK